MLAISKKTDYGLNFLIKLAHQNFGQPVTLTKIAKTTKLPGPFLAKLAANLVKAGIIKSREGVGGGYQLAKNPRKITLREILSALEGQTKNLSERTCNHLCGCAFCATRDIVKPLEAEIEQSLEAKTLEDFLDQGGLPHEAQPRNKALNEDIDFKQDPTPLKLRGAKGG